MENKKKGFLTMQCIYCCSVAEPYPTLCDPKDCSMQGFPVLHHLPELAQIHVHGVGDGIQLSHHWRQASSCIQSASASGSFPGSLHQEAKILELRLQHQSFQWIFRMISYRLNGLNALQSEGISRVFCNTTVWKHLFSSAQPSLWSNSHIHS